MNWLRARRALRMRPAANAATSRVTRTMPSSGAAPDPHAAVGIHPRHRGCLGVVGGIRGGRHPGTDQLARAQRQLGAACPLPPSEALGPELVAPTQRLAGERFSLGRIALGVVL